MVQPGFVDWNGHVLCAVDVETTGTDPALHDVIQIAIVPLDSNIEPIKGISPFYMTMKPEKRENEDKRSSSVHGIDLDELMIHAPTKWQVEDWLGEWFDNLDLPFGKKIIPLAQNWSFESGFLKAWLGVEGFDSFFYFHPRDTMSIAIYLNDKAYWRCQPRPFPRVGLKDLCRQLDVVNDCPHDALADARAEAEVYRKLMEFDL